MQKWEVAVLVLVAVSVAVVGSSQTLSRPLLELSDSLLMQLVAVFACVGLAYVSPTVGIALAVALALLFVLRNNSIVQNKILRPSVPAVTTSSASYTAPTTNIENEENVLRVDIRETPKDVTRDDVTPDGQYPVDEYRPTQTASLRPFEYSPQMDTGKNEFELVGESIDEKGMLPPSVKPWMGTPNPQVLNL
jgi:MFS superfamily sulfate permease-like transporter